MKSRLGKDIKIGSGLNFGIVLGLLEALGDSGRKDYPPPSLNVYI